MTRYHEIDLQLFAQEKELPATPRRRQLARERGQVFSSQDLTSAVSILVVVLTLRFTLKSTGFGGKVIPHLGIHAHRDTGC